MIFDCDCERAKELGPDALITIKCVTYYGQYLYIRIDTCPYCFKVLNGGDFNWEICEEILLKGHI